MNSLLLYTVCGLLTILIIYKQRKCWYFVWQLNGWRGLLQQPILWLILIIYLEPKSLMVTIQRCHKYFQRPLAVIVFNRILLYVDDPETMESIFTTPECLNKAFALNGFYANKGLLHAKDEQWKLRRKQLNPVFSQNTLVSFFDAFNRVSNELKLKFFQDLRGYKKVKYKNVEDLVTRAVLEVACITTMGYETHFLQNDDKGIAKAYRYLIEMTALRVMNPWYQIDFIFRLLDNKNYEKSKRAQKLVAEFVENIVQQKHTEWQQLRLQKQNITTNTTRNIRCNGDDDDVSDVTASNSPKDAMSLNEQENHNHNFSGKSTIKATPAAASPSVAIDALQNMTEKMLYHSNMLQQQQQQQQQKKRNFIDQIFYLAQTGKLTLEDIMNESQSMVVVAFETVSSFIISTLLCLAINRECQMKLRNEIKQIVLMSKDKTKSKEGVTTATTSIKHNNTITSLPSTYTNTADNSDVWNSKMTANLDCSSKAGGGIHFAHDGSAGDDDVDMQVTMEHLLNMPYLDMIINESLRLLTIVPMNLRSVSADFQLNVIQQKRDKYTRTSLSTLKSNISNNYNNNNSNNNKSRNNDNCVYPPRCIDVPKDTIIALDVFNMQRNEEYWGKNALKFYPEHFEKKYQHQQQQQQQEQQEYQHQRTEKSIKTGENKQEEEQENMPTSTSAFRHSYAFSPFAKGLRTCIGYRYSIYLSKIILIKLISSFEFSTNIQLQDLEFYEGVSLKFRNAHKIHFKIQPVG